MRVLLVATVVGALCAANSGAASTYRWTDDRGVIHLTDDPDKIPERYLKRTREIESAPAETTVSAPKAPVASSAPALEVPAAAATAPRPGNDERARLEAEQKRLKDGLDKKQQELDRLQHKWTVAKGRTPTEKEIEEFEKKRAEGKATFKDNPYVNKKPLSNPAPARAAYYAKLEEIRRDEARVQELEQQLNGIGR